MVDQDDLVSVLREIASYETGFKQQAFDNAALAIACLSKEEYTVYINHGRFTELRGVGKSVEKCIVEFIEKGTIERLEDHRRTHGDMKNPLYDI